MNTTEKQAENVTVVAGIIIDVCVGYLVYRLTHRWEAFVLAAYARRQIVGRSR